MNSSPSDAPSLITVPAIVHLICSPTLLDLVEIERKLKEAKAEREKLLRERVSHLSWETLADSSIISTDTLVQTRLSPLTPSLLLPADAQVFAMPACCVHAGQRSRVRSSKLCRLQTDRQNRAQLLVYLAFLIHCDCNLKKKGYFDAEQITFR